MLSQQEYEYYARRAAFEAMLAGEPWENTAGILDLEPEECSFVLVRFAVPAGAEQLRDALVGHFLKYPEYILMGWGVREYLVLIKAATGEMDRCVSRCVRAIRESHGQFGVADWHAAVTPPVAAAADLPVCYELLDRLWGHRYLFPGEHLLTQETVGRGADEESRLLELDPARMDPERLHQILTRADAGEVPGLVEQLLEEVEEVLRFDSICRYLAFSTRFTCAAFVEARGFDREEFIRGCRLALPQTGRITRAILTDYMIRALQGAVRYRDGDTVHGCRAVLQQAAAYIGGHFTQAGLSLEQVAAAVELSPNYLSALFRRELDCTFVEYLTGKRMRLARELLETTDLRSGEIARAVGYRDPRYFSSLFKKTQGVTPREYRTGKRNSDG